ncbi:hypothetical protein J5N97_015358 [Dioscorea zingiberensis]|uniref:Mediator of RNA polymerase II transcription subunit 19a n=1 Tax=Dioscorea zingiberensis TaxID=325984 RepID=A0A9D5CVK1_9LILI|nr:hypothetical protein J5N97_015358 [Dioscorea zingiberensis]
MDLDQLVYYFVSVVGTFNAALLISRWFAHPCGFDMMDPEGKKFGRGPRELTGAVDLINHYKLLPHHDFFCKRSLPESISDTHYLHNVVGDTEIRKGEGMELDQLFQNAPYLRETTAHIQPFDLETLGQAFQLRETSPIDLPSAEKGIPTISGKSKGDTKDKERKHKKHKDRDKDKDKEHKKHKHRHKDRSKDKDKERKKDKTGHQDSGGEPSKKHHDKKRKHEGSEDPSDIHKHKKSKHKSSKVDEINLENIGRLIREPKASSIIKRKLMPPPCKDWQELILIYCSVVAEDNVTNW